MSEQTPDPAAAMEQQLEPLSMVQLSPANLVMAILTGPDGKRFPSIRAETVIGSIILPMSPDKAREFALEMASCAAKCDSGLIVPGSGMQL